MAAFAVDVGGRIRDPIEVAEWAVIVAIEYGVVVVVVVVAVGEAIAIMVADDAAKPTSLTARVCEAQDSSSPILPG